MSFLKYTFLALALIFASGSTAILTATAAQAQAGTEASKAQLLNLLDIREDQLEADLATAPDPSQERDQILALLAQIDSVRANINVYSEANLQTLIVYFQGQISAN